MVLLYLRRQWKEGARVVERIPPRNRTASYCKSCHNEYQKDYYKKHPQGIAAATIKRKQAIKRFLRETKDVPCRDCKLRYPYYVMDFDHKRGQKVFNLSIAASKLYSMKKIKQEIKKCEIVCANCHRERTFKRAVGIGVAAARLPLKQKSLVRVQDPQEIAV